MKLQIREWTGCDVFKCFDIPESMRLDVTEIMLDKEYEMIANYSEEVTFQKVIGGKLYKISFEPNKHINNRRNDMLFDKILNLPE